MGLPKANPMYDDFHSKEDEEYIGSASFKNSRGITQYRKFLLALSRDVIARCTENIAQHREWDPWPGPPRNVQQAAAPSSAKNSRGRPPKHNPGAKQSVREKPPVCCLLCTPCRH
mmetsp:Transcript_31475/g.82580  ORF Transcript_31475/g.82580 Transcript_31475/m.82580 type:complete len:115 (-) Transcript_31475:203-547(-)